MVFIYFYNIPVPPPFLPSGILKNEHKANTKFTAKHSRGHRTAGLPLILRNESVCLRGFKKLENPAAGICMALEAQPYHTLQAARSCPVTVI